jgi:hypothetical protein
MSCAQRAPFPLSIIDGFPRARKAVREMRSSCFPCGPPLHAASSGINPNKLYRKEASKDWRPFICIRTFWQMRKTTKLFRVVVFAVLALTAQTYRAPVMSQAPSSEEAGNARRAFATSCKLSGRLPRKRASTVRPLMQPLLASSPISPRPRRPTGRLNSTRPSKPISRRPFPRAA